MRNKCYINWKADLNRELQKDDAWVLFCFCFAVLLLSQRKWLALQISPVLGNVTTQWPPWRMGCRQTAWKPWVWLFFIFYKWSWCWSFKWVKYGITYTHTEFSTTSPFPQLAALPGSWFAWTAREMDVNVIVFLCPFLAARDSSFTWAMQFAFLAQCFPSQLSSPSFWRTCI